MELPVYRPLTPEEEEDKRKCLDGYGHFWRNMAFQKGWARPPFSRRSVEKELNEAATYVARLRSHVKKMSGGKLQCDPEGSASEYLWSCAAGGLNRDKFVRDLVQSSFSNENGYVHGLSEETIDLMMQSIDESKREEEARLLASEARQKDLESIIEILTQLRDQAKDTVVHHSSVENHHLQKEKDSFLRIKKLCKQIGNEFEILGDVKESVSMSGSNSETKSGPCEATAASQKAAPEEDRPVAEEEHLSDSKRAEDDVKDMEVDAGAPAETVETDGNENIEDEMDVDSVDQKPEREKEEGAEMEEESAEKEIDDEPYIIEIKKIADAASGLAREIKSLHTKTDLMNFEQLLESPKKGASTVRNLQKQCQEYSGRLMLDLLKLDQIVGTEKTRPYRKQQVNLLNGLLDDVESLQQKLKSFHDTLASQSEAETSESDQHGESEASEAEKEKSEGKEEREKPVGQDEEAQEVPEKADKGKEPVEEADVENEDDDRRVVEHKMSTIADDLVSEAETESAWRKQVLRPRFNVNETGDAYILSAYVEGMKEEDISIATKDNNSVIEISGYRGPSEEELEQLRAAVTPFCYRMGVNPASLSVDQRKAVIHRLGAGRFGTFREAYAIPRDVDAEEVSAQYHNGNLRIKLPKRRRAVQYGGYPGQRVRGQDPFQFFSDRDMFW